MTADRSGEAWEDYFVEGEQLLWEGAPLPGTHNRPMLIFITLFGIPFFVAGAALTFGGLFFVFKAGNLTEAGGSLLAAVFGMPFLGVGLFLVVWQWVMAYTAHARIRYALSTRAAYIAKRYWRRELSIFPITKTTPLEMQDTRNGATVWLHALKQEDSDGDKVTTKIGFENIADGARVLGLLRNLQARL
ncbi:MAG: hypothetical protein KDE00_08375 [Rhodobacteraceae bacterium]|nr:hypothetical protein [Paracoccaceae bacterium]